MGHALKNTPHTIVILRALQLGDLLCVVPSFRALRAAYPRARITLVGLPWAKAFVERFSGYLDDFIEFPGWPGLPEREPRLAEIPDFLKEVLARRYHLALQMQGSGLVTNPLISLFGARQTAGFFVPGQFQPDPHTFMPYPEGEAEVRVFLRLLESLGVPAQGEQLEFPLLVGEPAEFEQLQARHDLQGAPYVLLHPGARDASRRWPPEKFSAVGDGLAAAGLRVLLTGAETERDLTAAVRQAMHAPALDLAGQTGLGALAQLIAGARLLISNDTGVSHIAAAMHTPSLILFSNSEPERWRPLDRARHHAILNSPLVSPADVLEEARFLLKEAHPNAQPAL